MPKVTKCSFSIYLNEALMSQLNSKLHEIFTYNSTKNAVETLLLEIGRRGLMKEQPNRISESISKEIFEKVRDDPCFKTISDIISLEAFFNLSVLLRTNYFNPRLHIYLSIYA